MEGLNQESRTLMDKLATDADAALKRNQATAEEQINLQVGDFRD